MTTLSDQLLAERQAERRRRDAAREKERAPVVAHAAVEETQRQIATIDARLDWLAPHVAEAEALKAERSKLAAQLKG